MTSYLEEHDEDTVFNSPISACNSTAPETIDYKKTIEDQQNYKLEHEQHNSGQQLNKPKEKILPVNRNLLLTNTEM